MKRSFKVVALVVCLVMAMFAFAACGNNGGTTAPETATDAPEAATDAPEAATDAPEAATDAPETATDAPAVG